VVTAAGALLLVACGAQDGDDEVQSQPAGQAEEGIEGVEAVRVADHSHTEADVDYDLSPPAGGPHRHEWWNCGFYDEPVPDEHAVHDLEHGAVWLAYSPDLTDADVEVIHDIARSEAKVLASPYPDLKTGEAVVATAWARQLRLDSVDDPRLAEFVAEYQDGSQAPEAGVTCSESPLGEPLP